MNINDIESQLQEHYNSEELPFEPAHWNDMEALLDKEMPTKKRRKFLLIWFFLLFGALGTLQSPENLSMYGAYLENSSAFLEEPTEAKPEDQGHISYTAYRQTENENTPKQRVREQELMKMLAETIDNDTKRTGKPILTGLDAKNKSSQMRSNEMETADQSNGQSANSEPKQVTINENRPSEGKIAFSMEGQMMNNMERSVSSLPALSGVPLSSNPEITILDSLCVDLRTQKHSEESTSHSESSEFTLSKPYRSKFSMSMGGGIFKPSRELTSASEQPNVFRAPYEKSVLAYNYGFSMRFAPFQHLYMSTGFSQLHIIEETLYPEVNLYSLSKRMEMKVDKRKEITSIDTVSISLGNDTKLIIDTHFVIHHDTLRYAVIDTSWRQHALIHNRVHISYNEIPISLGYQFSHRKWTFSLESSLYFSFLSSVSGSYQTLKDNEIHTFGKEYFKSSTIGLGTRIGIERSIRKNWGVAASLQHRRSIGSISSNPQLNHQYGHTGLRFSILYHF